MTSQKAPAEKIVEKEKWSVNILANSIFEQEKRNPEALFKNACTQDELNAMFLNAKCHLEDML